MTELKIETFALISALAIMCNDCKSSGMQNVCQGQLNSTNCTEMFDACATTAMTISMTTPVKLEVTVMVMNCAIKVSVP